MELKNFFAQDTAGNVIAEATAYVYEPDTVTLVTGLVDKDGDPLDNPFTGTVNGLIQFAAPDGEYDLRVVGASRDFTVRIQCLDASDVVAAAEAARDDAVTAKGEAEDAAAGAEAAATEAVKIKPAAKVATFTPAVADDANYYRYNSASAGDCNIPANADQPFPVGFTLMLRQMGAGQLIVVAAGGVTVNGVTDTLMKTRVQGSSLALVKVATDEWDLTGDLEAA